MKDKTYEHAPLLDAFLPSRSKKWINPGDRKASGKSPVIELNNFSFIDNPTATLKKMEEIVDAETRAFSYEIDFLDHQCLDIGPYLILGVMQLSMIANCEGGRLSPGLHSVLRAVGLDKLLGMSVPRQPKATVLPFSLKHGAAETTDDTRVGITTKQRAVDQFTSTLDDWLGRLGFALRDNGRGHVGQIIGEAIDNAERHADLHQRKGEWWITGFMTARADNNNKPTYHCHVALLSVGCSIAESINTAPPDTRSKIHRYAERHKSRHQSADTLSTVYALQDGITRDPPGGIGMMDFFDLVSSLGQSAECVNGAVVVISGDACIIGKDNYVTPVEVAECRNLWFNCLTSAPLGHIEVFA